MVSIRGFNIVKPLWWVPSRPCAMKTTYVMRVSLKGLLALPAHLPVPQLDCHIITGRQDERLRGMHAYRPDVVGVRLEARDLLRRVVVVDSELAVTNHLVSILIIWVGFLACRNTVWAQRRWPKPSLAIQRHSQVITAAHNPVLARDEPTRPHRDVSQLERLDGSLCLVAPYIDMAAVERRENPWLFADDLSAPRLMGFAAPFPSLYCRSLASGHGGCVPRSGENRCL